MRPDICDRNLDVFRAPQGFSKFAPMVSPVRPASGISLVGFFDLERQGGLLCPRLTGEEGIKPFIRSEFQMPAK